MMLCKLSDGRATFNPSSEPFQAVSKIVVARDEPAVFPFKESITTLEELKIF